MMPVLEVAMWGGLLGLAVFVMISTVVLLLRGPVDDPGPGCDCFACVTAREWREREEGWGA